MAVQRKPMQRTRFRTDYVRPVRRPLPLWWRILAVCLCVIFFIGLFAAGTIAGVIASYSQNLPDINRMADFQPERSTRLYARDGTLLANLYRQNRIWVPINKIPPIVRDAFIAVEDEHFYQHHGVDFQGIARAAIADWRHERFQGASTITQQLARALFLSGEVSVSRKIQEALLAMEIERFYTKDEILERYLNMIYFGSQAYGVEAAAHTYFGKSVQNLSVGQAALLAGLPAAPSDYSPYVNLSHAKQRQTHVLDRMVAGGYLTQAQAAAAYAEPLHLAGERSPGFRATLIRISRRTQSTNSKRRSGDKQRTKRACKCTRRSIPNCKNLRKIASIGACRAQLRKASAPIKRRSSRSVRQRERFSRWSAAPAAFSLHNQFNRAWQTRRQPGSSFKVYVYTAAIDSGMPPTAIMEDTPVSYPMGDGTLWEPKDDDLSYMGAIPLRTALAQSRNIVAVKLAQLLGVDRVIAYAQRMGVRSPLEANLSLALGTSGVSPLDMASGFSTLANQGVHIEPSPFRIVKDSLGTMILDNRFPQQTEVVGAGTAYIMDSMMESVIQSGTGIECAKSDGPQPARPERPRASAMPGSSGSRRISWRRFGWATTITRR